MAEEDGKEPRPRGRWRRWLGRIGWTLLALLVLVAVFHRTIIFEGTRYFVVRAAKQQNLDIDYEIGGTIFSTLTVSNFEATPTEPGPIQRIEIGNINLRYSLWGALRNGLPALLDLVAVTDAVIEITPSEEPPPEKRDEPQQFKFPALFPKILQIENMNFLSHAKAGDFVIEGFWLTLLPDEAGVLKIRTLDVPGVRKWVDIDGRTTFRDRNLLIADFRIGEEIQLDRLNLDASQLDEQRLGIGIDGVAFEAPISLAVRIENLNDTNDLTAKLSIERLVFQRVWDYLNLDVALTGGLDLAEIDFSGRPEEPVTWAGTAALRLADLVSGAQAVGDIRVDLALGDGGAELNLAGDPGGGGGLSLVASVELPEKLDGFVGSRVEGEISIHLPDLAAITGAMPEPAGGDVDGRVDFHLENRVFRADVNLRSSSLTASGATLSDVVVKVHGTKNLDVSEDAPPFEGATATLGLEAARVGFADYEIDSIELTAGLNGANVILESLSVSRGSNGVNASGAYTLPADMVSFAAQPWKADVSVKAPALHEFVAGGGGAGLRGSLEITGTVRSDGRDPAGEFDIVGRDIAFDGLDVPTIDGTITAADNVARLADFAIVLDEDNSIRASGEVQLAKPYRYQGTLKANLADLSVFDPLSPEPLAGSFSADWEGGGDFQKQGHTGAGVIDLTNGQFGAHAGINAEIRANYTPGMLDIPVLRASAEMGSVAAKVHWENKQLAVTDIVGQLKELTVLTGSAELPLDLAHPGDIDRLFPNDGAVNVALAFPEVQLASVFAQWSADDAPVSGSVGMKLTASGTIEDLAADLSLRAKDVAAAAAAGVQPADVSLDLALRDDRLAVEGRITESQINPVIISGGLPLDVVQIKREKALPPETPLDLRIRMADSKLGFVAALVPAIRFIDGTAGIDLEVTGTTASPRVMGNLSADIRYLHLNNEGLPPITNVVVQIDSTTDRLTVAEFRGEIGGGVFGAEGTVDFSNLEKPVFGLAFGTRNALVLQDEAITLRISSRVRVDGPLDGATVSGDVYVTRSRFYKDIDILPIGLPGRPAPRPPEAPPAPGIPDPPLRNWKFDIAVKTADPFLVQGNLANGRVTVDLHVGGTGMNPWADGSVRIEQLRTSLPFSTLEIDNGLVYFTKERPFLPQFDIRGTSQIRDYDITAYVYGDMTNPQATFTSNPPLPQTEIVSLIATGVTSKELAGNPSVIAGKAATLLFQKIYRSVFHRGSTEPSRDTLLSRIDFELGATDPKTGRQGIGARFPLTDNIVLSSGVDVGGDFRGQVRYLIRFR